MASNVVRVPQVGEIHHHSQLVHSPDDGFSHFGETRVHLLIMGASHLVPGAVGQLAVANAERVVEVETPDGVLDVRTGKAGVRPADVPDHGMLSRLLEFRQVLDSKELLQIVEVVEGVGFAGQVLEGGPLAFTLGNPGHIGETQVDLRSLPCQPVVGLETGIVDHLQRPPFLDLRPNGGHEQLPFPFRVRLPVQDIERPSLHGFGVEPGHVDRIGTPIEIADDGFPVELESALQLGGSRLDFVQNGFSGPLDMFPESSSGQTPVLLGRRLRLRAAAGALGEQRQGSHLEQEPAAVGC